MQPSCGRCEVDLEGRMEEVKESCVSMMRWKGK